MAECRGFKNKLGTTIVSLIAKVAGAVAGNIATFNSDGELADSGKSVDTQVTSGSSNLITSGAVYNGLQERPSRKEMGATIHSMLVLVKTSYHNSCQGRDTYNFQEYIETYTDVNGRLWTIYLWSDGGADYFMLDSPAKMHIGTIIYNYSVSAIAAIKANTASTITAALTSFEYDTVLNI